MIIDVSTKTGDGTTYHLHRMEHVFMNGLDLFLTVSPDSHKKTL